MIRSLVVVLLALPLTHADYSAISGRWISCEQFVVQERGTIEQVCAKHTVYTRFDEAATNSSDYDMVDQVQTFDILEQEENRTSEDRSDYYDNNSTGITVELTQSFIEGTCGVTINGASCDNCKYCGSNSTIYVSVDCSVVPGGRAVECESNDNVFLPIEGYASVDAIADDGDVSLNGDISPYPSSSGASDGYREESFNPPSEADSTPSMESSSYRCISVSIAVIATVVGSIIQI